MTLAFASPVSPLHTPTLNPSASTEKTPSPDRAAESDDRLSPEALAKLDSQNQEEDTAGFTPEDIPPEDIPPEGIPPEGIQSPEGEDEADVGQPDEQDFDDFDEELEARIIGRHGLQQLDLLLTTIEALNIKGNEAMIYALQQGAEPGQTPVSRVEFWKRRTTNPLRRTMRRSQMKKEEVMGMVELVCTMATGLYPLLHQLVSIGADQSLAEARWTFVSKRLQGLVQQRMNPRRAAIQKFADDDHAMAMAKQMVRALLFSAGPGGQQRLLASLQDGMRS